MKRGLRARRLLSVLACALAACGGETVAVPDFARAIPGSACAVFVAHDAAMNARVRELVEPFALPLGLTLDGDALRSWVVDPRTPSGAATLADSQTFRAALAAEPIRVAEPGTAFVFLDLQAVVDGARVRVAEALAKFAPVLDAAGLTTLWFAAGELTFDEKALRADLLVMASDPDAGPLGLLARGPLGASLLSSRHAKDRARLELRAAPLAVLRLLDSVNQGARAGEMRLDAAALELATRIARVFTQQADGRVSWRVDARGAASIAIGVHDQHEAREALAAVLPIFDVEEPRLPMGFALRFLPGRLLLEQGEPLPGASGQGELEPRGPLPPDPAGDLPAPPPSDASSRPFELDAVLLNGRALHVDMAHDGVQALRVRLRVD